MVQILTKPKYPVIDDKPTLGQCFAAFRSRDWQILVVATAGSLPFGYWAGRPLVMRPTMVTAGMIGALYGVFNGFQNSFARLTGFKENDIEVAKYAVANEATVKSA